MASIQMVSISAKISFIWLFHVTAMANIDKGRVVIDFKTLWLGEIGKEI